MCDECRKTRDDYNFISTRMKRGAKTIYSEFFRYLADVYDQVLIDLVESTRADILNCEVPSDIYHEIIATYILEQNFESIESFIVGTKRLRLVNKKIYEALLYHFKVFRNSQKNELKERVVVDGKFYLI
jgi:hypothetical protein